MIPTKTRLEDFEIEKLAHLFKMLNQGSRLRILHALSQETLSVEALTLQLGMSQSAISHQLKELRDAKLVDFEKKGKYSYYFLNDTHVYQIYMQALAHIREECK